MITNSIVMQTYLVQDHLVHPGLSLIPPILTNLISPLHFT